MRDSSCHGKFRHGSHAAALRSIRHPTRRDAIVTAYRCRKCGGWHVGGSLTSPEPYRRERIDWTAVLSEATA